MGIQVTRLRLELYSIQRDLTLVLNKRALHNKGEKRKCEHKQKKQTDSLSTVSRARSSGRLREYILQTEERSSLLPTKPNPTWGLTGVN